MVPINFSVSLDAKAPPVLTDTVTFETGATVQQVRDSKTFAYNHHGDGFGDASPGALTTFYEDLILGRPLPTKMVSKRVEGMDTVVAFTLFMHRELAVQPRTPGFVATIDLLHRRGLTVVGHADPEVEHLVYLLNDLPSGSVEDWLPTAMGWVRTYLLTGQVPGTPRQATVRVVDRGTNGFVVATSPERNLVRAWVELYRQGFLQGVVFGPEDHGRRHVLIGRKSPYLPLNLHKAATIFNEMEAAMGSSLTWILDGVWLASPPQGTHLLPEHLVEVLTRV